jgi:DUF2975 family protein
MPAQVWPSPKGTVPGGCRGRPTPSQSGVVPKFASGMESTTFPILIILTNNDNNILTNDKPRVTVDLLLSEVLLMKKGSTLFLKFVICLISIGALIWLIWFPQLEGRAANLDLISIYRDPLIIYAYIGSIPFFVGLYQAFKLLGYIDGNKVFSQSSVNAMKNIKYCAITFSGFIVLGILYIRLFVRGDDPAGVTALGIFTTFASIVIATAAAVFQRLLQNAVDLKSENDLTV